MTPSTSQEMLIGSMTSAGVHVACANRGTAIKTEIFNDSAIENIDMAYQITSGTAPVASQWSLIPITAVNCGNVAAQSDGLAGSGALFK
jgi:hypothetical protein